MPTGKCARPWEKHRRTRRASGLASHTYLNITGPEVSAAKQLDRESWNTQENIWNKSSSWNLSPGVGAVEQGVGCQALGAWMSVPLLPEQRWRCLVWGARTRTRTWPAPLSAARAAQHRAKGRARLCIYLLSIQLTNMGGGEYKPSRRGRRSCGLLEPWRDAPIPFPGAQSPEKLYLL